MVDALSGQTAELFGARLELLVRQVHDLSDGEQVTQHIAGVLVQMQQDKLGIDYLDRRASLIGGVTLDEARSVAKKLFDPGALSFAVVGDPADVEPTRSPRPPKF